MQKSRTDPFLTFVEGCYRFSLDWLRPPEMFAVATGWVGLDDGMIGSRNEIS